MIWRLAIERSSWRDSAWVFWGCEVIEVNFFSEKLVMRDYEDNGCVGLGQSDELFQCKSCSFRVLGL